MHGCLACKLYIYTRRGICLPRETTGAAASRAVVDLRAAGTKVALLRRGVHVAHERVVLAVAAGVAAIVVVREVLFGMGGRGAVIRKVVSFGCFWLGASFCSSPAG